MDSLLRDTAFGDLQAEMATTRRVLERVPEEHLGWKPHERSMALGALAAHVATIPILLTYMFSSDELDFETAPPRPPPPDTAAAILATFDQTTGALAGALAAASPESLAVTWTMRRGAHVVVSGTRAANLRTIGISHIVHHRGQLSVYLRLLGVPVPSIYGPSADEGRPG